MILPWLIGLLAVLYSVWVTIQNNNYRLKTYRLEIENIRLKTRIIEEENIKLKNHILEIENVNQNGHSE